MRLAKQLYDEMKRHAVEAYPEECCGFILYDPEEDREFVRRIRNVATERHQADPAAFPRDGRNAYLMDEEELLEVSRALEDQTLELRAIYHSHPNGKAYFSTEDEARAKIWGEPIFPEAYYIVLGTDGTSITGMTAHLWNEERREYEDVRVVRT